MGTRINEIVGGIGQTNVAPVTPYEAVISNTVTAVGQELFVTIPSIDQGRTTKGPVRWTALPGPSGALIFPTAKDIAQVVRTQEGYYWVTQFIPAVYPTDLLIASRVTALESLAHEVRSQASSMAAQSGPSNGVAWPLNVSGAPFLDLTPGTWKIDAGATMFGNVADYAIIGLYNQTTAAGISFSGGTATIVGPISGSSGYGTPTTSTFLTVIVNARYRIWVIPNGASTQTVVASAAVPTAVMAAYRIR